MIMSWMNRLNNSSTEVFKDTKGTKCSRPIPAVSLGIVRNSDVVSNWVGGAQSGKPAGALMSQVAEPPKHAAVRRLA